MPREIRQVLLLSLIIALNLLDATTTIYSLCYLGAMPHIEARELNPLFRIENLPIKLAMPLVYALAFLVCYHFCRRIGFVKGLKILNLTLAGLVAIFAVVVANNLIQVARVIHDLL